MVTWAILPAQQKEKTMTDKPLYACPWCCGTDLLTEIPFVFEMGPDGAVTLRDEPAPPSNISDVTKPGHTACSDCLKGGHLVQFEVAPDVVPVIECPDCSKGEGPVGLRYVEDISNARRVSGFTGGVLLIDGGYTAEGYDEAGENERLQCGECGKEMPIPRGTPVEFI